MKLLRYLLVLLFCLVAARAAATGGQCPSGGWTQVPGMGGSNIVPASGPGAGTPLPGTYQNQYHVFVTASPGSGQSAGNRVFYTTATVSSGSTSYTSWAEVPNVLAGPGAIGVVSNTVTILGHNYTSTDLFYAGFADQSIYETSYVNGSWSTPAHLSSGLGSEQATAGLGVTATIALNGDIQVYMVNTEALFYAVCH